MRAKTVFIGLAVAILALGTGVWLTSTVSSNDVPSPNDVSRLLYADVALKKPLTMDFPTEFTRTFINGEREQDFVLEEYLEAQVFDRLGLITVTFDKVKAETRDCYSYRMDALFPSAFRTGPPSVPVRDPNGPYERCDDVWNYHTRIEFVDPDTVEPTALSETVQTLPDIPLPPPPRTSPAGSREAGVRSTTVPIASIEIVEVSDVVSGQRMGTYTVGFKFRIKPNGLGALFDLNSPVHQSLPSGIRQLFKSKLFDKSVDRRLGYIASANGSDGLTLGHADLVREGIFNRQWKVANVSFDLQDKTEYTFHRVD